MPIALSKTDMEFFTSRFGNELKSFYGNLTHFNECHLFRLNSVYLGKVCFEDSRAMELAAQILENQARVCMEELPDAQIVGWTLLGTFDGEFDPDSEDCVMSVSVMVVRDRLDDDA